MKFSLFLPLVVFGLWLWFALFPSEYVAPVRQDIPEEILGQCDPRGCW
jgi:hypothetical protein